MNGGVRECPELECKKDSRMGSFQAWEDGRDFNSLIVHRDCSDMLMMKLVLRKHSRPAIPGRDTIDPLFPVPTL